MTLKKTTSEFSADLSIIVINWNTRELLHQCLQSIEDTVTANYEVWVVDNASSDSSVAMVQEHFPHTHLIANQENLGFVRANNQALERCQGRYVLLLNSDTEVLPGSLDRSIAYLDTHPKVGIMGVRLLNPDHTFQASYTPFPTLWRECLILSGLGRWLIHDRFPSHGPEIKKGAQQIQGYMEGAYLMARHQAVKQVGLLDERIFMYAEDVDWCYRFYRAGWQVVYLPEAPIIHYGGQSSKKRKGRMEAELYRSRVYFFNKHYGRFAAFCLQALIYLVTGVKILVHRILQWISRGRIGRSVTSWQELRAALTNIPHSG